MRKPNILIAVFITLSLVLFLDESFAQRDMKGKGSDGRGIGSQYGRMYNPTTVETINGEVVSVDRVTSMKGMGYGIHLMVKTDNEEISVHLGPGWFIENQEMKIEPKDKIQVKGSRISFDGKPTIVAAEVMKENKVLKLRDKNGVPVWRGSRGRRQ